MNADILGLILLGIAFLLGLKLGWKRQVRSGIIFVISLLVAVFFFKRIFGSYLPVVVSVSTGLQVFGLQLLFFFVLYGLLRFFSAVFAKKKGKEGSAGPEKWSARLAGGLLMVLKCAVLIVVFIMVMDFFKETSFVPHSAVRYIRKSKTVSLIQGFDILKHWQPLGKVRRFVNLLDRPDRVGELVSQEKAARLRMNPAFSALLAQPPQAKGVYLFGDSRVKTVMEDEEVYTILFES